jgi:hypothetical protein
MHFKNKSLGNLSSIFLGEAMHENVLPDTGTTLSHI